MTICSKTGLWASVARRIVVAVLLGQAFSPADAAEPERLSESALQQIRALQQEKQSRSAVHRKLDSQLVFQLRLNRGQSIAPGLSRLKPDLKLERDGRVCRHFTLLREADGRHVSKQASACRHADGDWRMTRA